MKKVVVVLSLMVSYTSYASAARKVYINGTDVTGAREQLLQKVDVKISDTGDIYITAPHYQVYEEDSFTPLSAYQKSQQDKGTPMPAHKAPEGISMSDSVKAPDAASQPIPVEPAGK